MNTRIKSLELIDLISAKHFQLRTTNEQLWSNSDNISITNSEWFIISLIYGKQPTISEIAQQVHISRQATHKCIKALNYKGLIIIDKVENNNKNKCLKLTPLGEKCFLENELIKEEIERNIIAEIGHDNVILLKNLLLMKWG